MLPESYTSTYFAQEILQETKAFIYNNLVCGELSAYQAKLPFTFLTTPRFQEVEIEEDGSYQYLFEVGCKELLKVSEWEKLDCVIPSRKNYNDIDIQVTNFIKKLEEVAQQSSNNTIEVGDWVCFSTVPTALFPKKGKYWFFITSNENKNGLEQALLGKSCKETVHIQPDLFYYNAPSSLFASEENFTLTIESILKKQSFSIKTLQHLFTLHTPEEIHGKLIEIFSFREDIPLRKAIIEEFFYAAFLKYRFEIPPHSIIRKKQELLELLKTTHEHRLFTKNDSFVAALDKLAELKIKETALMDSIAFQEAVTVSDEDIKAYLECLEDPRGQEFIHFNFFNDQYIDITHPFLEDELLSFVKREKTLNTVLKKIMA